MIHKIVTQFANVVKLGIVLHVTLVGYLGCIRGNQRGGIMHDSHVRIMKVGIKDNQG